MDNPAEITNREFSEMVATLKSNTDSVRELIHIIRGNGTIGLLTRIDRLERDAILVNGLSVTDRIRIVESEIIEIKKFIGVVYKGVWSFVFLFVLFLSGLAWAILTHSVEIIFK